MKRESIIIKELAVIERKLKEVTNDTAKEALRKKRDRLKAELKDPSQSTNVLAKKLLAEREAIKQLSKIDFNDLVRRLSKKPEYAFLKTMPKGIVRNDIERKAKPVGWRFKGRGNYDKPTKAEVAKGKKNGTVYREVRPRRSDVSFVARLEDGGPVGKYTIEDFPVGSIIQFKNGEEWKVVKAGMRGSNDRVKSNEITIFPHNKKAKETHISMSIDITLEYLNKNVKKVFTDKMKDGGRIDTLIEEIKMFDKYNYPKPQTKGGKVRAIFKHCESKGYTTSEINKALGAMKYEQGGSMYKDGGILTPEQETDFNAWIVDGNVVQLPSGDYATQDAQWSNRLSSMDEVKKYYKKEFLSYYKGGDIDNNLVIFSVNDEALDSLLQDHHGEDLDYTEISGDSYYTLNRKDFERFLDAAMSKGFDVDYINSQDSVIDVMSDGSSMYKKGGSAKGLEIEFLYGDVYQVIDANSNKVIMKGSYEECLEFIYGSSMYKDGGDILVKNIKDKANIYQRMKDIIDERVAIINKYTEKYPNIWNIESKFSIEDKNKFDNLDKEYYELEGILTKKDSKYAFGGLIDENNISTGTIIRMSELVPQEAEDNMIANAQKVMNDLLDEGFEKEEVFSYMAHILVKNVKDNKTLTSQKAKMVQEWSGEYSEEDISDVLNAYERMGVTFPSFFVTVAGPTPEADSTMVWRLVERLPEITTNRSLTRQDIKNITWGIVMAARQMTSNRMK